MNLQAMAGQLALLRTLESRAVRKLPPRALWRLRSLLAGERLTRIDGRYVVNSFLPPFPGPAFDALGRGIASLLAGRPVPVSAYIAVTTRCPYRCWHCSGAHRPEQSLPYALAVDTIRQLQDLGVSIVGFTGGEPLQRGDIADLVGAVDARSVSLLFTSGHGLTSECAARLKAGGLFGCAVSLDHHTAAGHDRRRGCAGAFCRAVDAVGESRRAGFYTMLQLVATPENMAEGEMDRYLGLAAEMGVHEIRLLEPMPAGRLLDGGAVCRIDSAQRERLRQVHRRTNRGGKLPKVEAFAEIEHGDSYGCGAGFQHLYIDAGGNVCPCDFVPVSFGNVRDEPLAAIWERMNRAFARPRRNCFLIEHAAELREAFRGRLPIPYEDVARRIDFAYRGELPGFYRKIGYRQATEGLLTYRESGGGRPVLSRMHGRRVGA
ncbi:MAG: radical SAM protein [Lentisphaerae bacterium]|nr:radical SAM protein [Lentisphaerota bacterium]